MDALIKKYE